MLNLAQLFIFYFSLTFDVTDILDELVMRVNKQHILFKSCYEFRVLMHFLKVNILLPEIMFFFLIMGIAS